MSSLSRSPGKFDHLDAIYEADACAANRAHQAVGESIRRSVPNSTVYLRAIRSNRVPGRSISKLITFRIGFSYLGVGAKTTEFLVQILILIQCPVQENKDFYVPLMETDFDG